MPSQKLLHIILGISQLPLNSSPDTTPFNSIIKIQCRKSFLLLNQIHILVPMTPPSPISTTTFSHAQPISRTIGVRRDTLVLLTTKLSASALPASQDTLSTTPASALPTSPVPKEPSMSSESACLSVFSAETSTSSLELVSAVLIPSTSTSSTALVSPRMLLVESDSGN